MEYGEDELGQTLTKDQLEDIRPFEMGYNVSKGIHIPADSKVGAAVATNLDGTASLNSDLPSSQLWKGEEFTLDTEHNEVRTQQSHYAEDTTNPLVPASVQEKSLEQFEYGPGYGNAIAKEQLTYRMVDLMKKMDAQMHFTDQPEGLTAKAEDILRDPEFFANTMQELTRLYNGAVRIHDKNTRVVFSMAIDEYYTEEDASDLSYPRAGQSYSNFYAGGKGYRLSDQRVYLAQRIVLMHKAVLNQTLENANPACLEAFYAFKNNILETEDRIEKLLATKLAEEE